MSSSQHLSSAALIQSLHAAASQEREALAQYIADLSEALRRRLYVEQARSSLFVWLTKDFGLSSSGASRRIAVVKLLHRLPDLAERVLSLLRTGMINLENMAMLAGYVSYDNAESFWREIPGMNDRELEAFLNQRFPGRAKKKKRDYEKPVVVTPTVSPTLILQDLARSEDRVVATEASPKREPLWSEPLTIASAAAAESTPELGLEIRATLKGEEVEALKRLRELFPGNSLSDILGSALKHYRRKKDPALQAKPTVAGPLKTKSKTKAKVDPKPAGAKPVRKPIPKSVRAQVYQRDGGQCVFTNAVGERCGEKGHLHVDHKVPVARGGSNEASNLRLLCFSHNMRAAEQEFGQEFMARKRERRS